ncbi:DUF3307 domain-containing protein [Solitalea koreensis]|uniref:DUF3307 domain-containing protein n=1 Tax=Solitalea koreensis TaxID=543615 RepID=A0A521BA22_9SPHI|nr:DUF3307 domain-containing protein [Solitalea koreensis]SMO43956.1 Protein of unknown function [Solitalea koreensis]
MPDLFTYEQGSILIRLLIAHLLIDFVLQPKSWVVSKQQLKGKTSLLYLHGVLSGVLATLFLVNLGGRALAAGTTIAITHTAIDYWKVNQKKNNLPVFLFDQLFHLIVILIVWLRLINGWEVFTKNIVTLLSDFNTLLITSAYIVVIWPMGMIINMATKSWREKINDDQASLENAGKWIGIFERIMVLTFVLMQQYEGIGFLIAAKSILRYSDQDEDKNKARKQTEYVLIGTLISFSLSILLGVGINKLIK